MIPACPRSNVTCISKGQHLRVSSVRLRARHLDLGRVFEHRGDYRFDGFDDFLRVYQAACLPLQQPGDFYRLALAVLEDRAADGVVYAEGFLSPDFCGGGDPSAWREYCAAIAEAAAEVEAEVSAGITLRGTVTAIRHLGPSNARQAARCTAETAGGFNTGFGIAGDERAGAARDFSWAIDCAREAGLGLTGHAGEWTGPASVRAALDAWGVARIGHGDRAIEDPSLVSHLAERGIVPEMCPGSNLALGL